ncbi:MAG: hypothetical protein JO217_07205 [Acidobacteriaceae bacterium]|nr:hypothetical protein [Acidobacteriaceae bacterium]
MKARLQLGLAVLAAFFAGCALAQTGPGQQSANTSGVPSKEWDFLLSTFGYLVPNDLSYAQPTVNADHNWLHLEGRYNYENQKTGSLWAGYNFSAGHDLEFQVTPKFGVVFGNMTGVAPGYEASLAYKKIELLSEGEYVFDTRNSNNNFFYSWDELIFSPVRWCHFGLVSQHTKAYQTRLDVQRGVSLGFAYRNLDYTTYIFDSGSSNPTVVLALTYRF